MGGRSSKCGCDCCNRNEDGAKGEHNFDDSFLVRVVRWWEEWLLSVYWGVVDADFSVRKNYRTVGTAWMRQCLRKSSLHIVHSKD